MSNSLAGKDSFLPGLETSISQLLTWKFPLILPPKSDATPFDYLSPADPTITTLCAFKNVAVPPYDIRQAINKTISTCGAEYKSVLDPNQVDNHGTRYPLSILDFWHRSLDAQKEQKRWMAAEMLLDKLKSHKILEPTHRQMLADLRNVMSRVSWTRPVKGFHTPIQINNLVAFGTTEWLDDSHISVMLEQLDRELASGGMAGEIIFLDPLQYSTLVFVHDNPHLYQKPLYQWLRQIAEDLATGISNKLGCIMNKGGTHWTVFLMDFQKETISYGDSYMDSMGDRDCETLQWWISQHEFSNTDTYWSNQTTMRDFVDHILAPYFNGVKQAQGLPPTQKALWTIDVWSVHRSKEFITWMKTNHPNIILDFVPGGCTGVAQPCDVGIQRPFKLSTKRSYHEDVVEDFVDQMKNSTGLTTLMVEKRLGIMRDRSVRWLWNAYKALNREDLVKKASLKRTITFFMEYLYFHRHSKCVVFVI
ncbi:hypothetical protein C0991_007362 [Blastosporella zonata]|nr:hypothetical protein C0991_007362 [Blastosporella zonata]